MNRIEHSVRLQDPGELVAAIPYILGFHPDDSLVLITVRGPTHSLGPCLRADLVPPSDALPLADYLLHQVGRYDLAGILIAVVGGCPPATHADALPREDLVRCIASTFVAMGIPIGYCVWASSTRHGTPWRLYGNERTGTVPDPSSTPVAATAVLAGEVTFSSREGLAATLTPDVETMVLEHRARALHDQVGIAAVERLLNRDTTARAGLAGVRRAIEQAADGHLPGSDEEVIPLAIALSDPRVTETCLALCLSDHAAAAEQLWLALVRGVPAPYRAEPAVLLAVSAYLRGQGALAQIALDNAESADPGHRFAQLLRTALVAGMPPDDLATLLVKGAARNELLSPDKHGG